MHRSIFVVLVAALAAPSFGATVRKKKPGRYQVGPIYFTPVLTLQNAGVDTNVFNSRTDPIRDLSIALSPSLMAAVPVGSRFRLTGSGLDHFFAACAWHGGSHGWGALC